MSLRILVLPVQHARNHKGRVVVFTKRPDVRAACSRPRYPRRPLRRAQACTIITMAGCGQVRPPRPGHNITKLPGTLDPQQLGRQLALVLEPVSGASILSSPPPFLRPPSRHACIRTHPRTRPSASARGTAQASHTFTDFWASEGSLNLNTTRRADGPRRDRAARRRPRADPATPSEHFQRTNHTWTSPSRRAPPAREPPPARNNSRKQQFASRSPEPRRYPRHNSNSAPAAGPVSPRGPSGGSPSSPWTGRRPHNALTQNLLRDCSGRRTSDSRHPR